MSTNFGDVIAAHGTRVLQGTTDVDEAAEAMRRAGLRPIRIVPKERGRGIKADLQVLPQSGSIGLLRLSFGTVATVTPQTADADVFMFAAPSSGRAIFRASRTAATFTRGSAGFIDPYRDFWAETTADYDCSVMTVGRGHLESVAHGLLDGAHDRRLEFAYNRDIVSSASPATYLITALAQLVADPDPAITEKLRVRMADVALEAALLGTPSFYESFATRAAAHGRTVRVVMEFIDAHLDEPLSLTQLAAIAMVSPRALQLAFRKELGVSPMRWLKHRRLQNARKLLTSRESAHLTISAIASLSGLHHMSEFSKSYREHYGETPSETRRQQAT